MYTKLRIARSLFRNLRILSPVHANFIRVVASRRHMFLSSSLLSCSHLHIFYIFNLFLSSSFRFHSISSTSQWFLLMLHLFLFSSFLFNSFQLQFLNSSNFPSRYQSSCSSSAHVLSVPVFIVPVHPSSSISQRFLFPFLTLKFLLNSSTCFIYCCLHRSCCFALFNLSIVPVLLSRH